MRTLVPALALLLAASHPTYVPPIDRIAANDNTAAAGVLRAGVLELSLVAGAGEWRPEGDAGLAHVVYAFGTPGRLTNPGPLIRVPAGTRVRASVRNDLEAPLVIRGLHDRPGAPAPLIIEPGASGQVDFRLDAPGTYLYWGSTRNAASPTDRWGSESQLGGAIVVDPPGEPKPDHVFVIGVLDDSAARPALRRLRAAVVNGRSWPYAFTGTAAVGDTVRMRWINASDRMHPMHLHGFYFRVDARGDATADSIYQPAQRRLVVTELMMQGATMALTWVPERAGNWLMHCHMAEHMSPALRGRPPAHDAHALNHATDVMSGLVTGWRITARKGDDPLAFAPPAARRLRLHVRSLPAHYGADAGLAFALERDGSEQPPSIPGPPLVLVRGEPVEITVVNHLDAPTSVHWHGIELDSYYDGVSGWSGMDGRVAPHVGARDSFVVRFTPPRAGTFIYHSHFDEEHQLSSGLYGALLVLEPGEEWDPESDRVWILSKGGPGAGPRLNLNGSATPRLELTAGRRYRVRLINIGTNAPVLLTVTDADAPLRWRALAKDGAELPPAQATDGPAAIVIGVGETWDFEFGHAAPAELRVTAVGPAGTPILLTGTVAVRAP